MSKENEKNILSATVIRKKNRDHYDKKRQLKQFKKIMIKVAEKREKLQNSPQNWLKTSYKYFQLNSQNKTSSKSK